METVHQPPFATPPTNSSVQTALYGDESAILLESQRTPSKSHHRCRTKEPFAFLIRDTKSMVADIDQHLSLTEQEEQTSIPHKAIEVIHKRIPVIAKIAPHDNGWTSCSICTNHKFRELTQKHDAHHGRGLWRERTRAKRVQKNNKFASFAARPPPPRSTLSDTSLGSVGDQPIPDKKSNTFVSDVQPDELDDLVVCHVSPPAMHTDPEQSFWGTPISSPTQVLLDVHDGFISSNAPRCRSETFETTGFVPMSLTLRAPPRFSVTTRPERVWS